MSSAAFFFGLLTAVLVIATSSCPEHISCPCGSSSKIYTFCVNDTWAEPYTCDRWAHCETCEDNITHCVTCPPSRKGQFCLEVESENNRWKRQVVNAPEQNNTGQFDSCPSLVSPDSGGISCEQSRNYRICTGYCLPGYVFDDEEYIDEIILICREGIWRPRHSFPPCKSEGITSRRICRCENGGVCDNRGKCKCPKGTTGEFCESYSIVFCPDPGPILFGIRRNGDGSIIESTQVYTAGQIVFYSCREGYELRGNEAITCLRTRAWSNKRPRCLKRIIGGSRGQVLCQHPGLNENTALTGDYINSPLEEEFPSGVELRYVCKKGFEPEGPMILYCLRTGQWTSDTPTCRTSAYDETRIQCTPPGVDPNADVEVPPIDPQNIGSGFDVGEVLSYTCRDGYEMEGQAKITCLQHGQWSYSAPKCHLRSQIIGDSTNVDQCKNHGPISNGIVVVIRNNRIQPSSSPSAQTDFEYPVGTQLHYYCNHGYVSRGERNLVCERGGFWSGEVPICIEVNSPPEHPIQCLHPGVDTNAEVEIPLMDSQKIGTGFDEGVVLSYTCKDGYELDGEAFITCERNGQWSAPSPRCNFIDRKTDDSSEEEQCEYNGPIPNGLVEVFSTLNEHRQPSTSNSDQDDLELPFGTRLQYSCEEGYFLRGDSNLVCESGGFWSSEEPVCMEDCGRSALQTTRPITRQRLCPENAGPWLSPYEEI
ncbi:sushi, von Willebrand factor type A, EGF and pentraxin domain-containing protein 1 [Nephila pilipes]|uniref:Sushi, von Willebrand factor type A, EGF and pentraxin domain-containing protein 1 n=1 Tax=Nephila pilipes TaxID=299642 RepID=A0A8X6NTM6_NEPPI|nr:sushi, von Willebrand factor type A, EGF and pentraxin domain-containing protein 1 [Nephila pilipes]